MTRISFRSLASAALAATFSLGFAASDAAAATSAVQPDVSVLGAASRHSADAPYQLARRGADDGAGHDVGDDRGGRGDRARGRGADDGPNHNAGDDRGRRGRDGGKGRGRGADDGPNHS